MEGTGGIPGSSPETPPDFDQFLTYCTYCTYCTYALLPTPKRGPREATGTRYGAVTTTVELVALRLGSDRGTSLSTPMTRM